MKRIIHLILLGRSFASYHFQFSLINLRWILVRSGAIKQQDSLPCVISLTSYPERFKSLNVVLKSLLSQSKGVEEIRVYVDSGNEQETQKLIHKYSKFGVNFLFCDESLKSYTKLIPTLREIKNLPIITVDDDVLYRKTMVEELWKFHKIYPIYAIGHRGVIRPQDSSTKEPYFIWPEARHVGEGSMNVLLTGMAGILYPPDSLHEIVLERTLFKKLAPTADDLWFNYCLRKRNTKSFLIGSRNRDPFSIKGSQARALWVKNVDGHLNDSQLQQIIGALGPLD